LRQAEHAFALIGLGTILFFACFDISRIASNSMSPTLCGNDWQSGDCVLAEKVTYWFRGPRRWEVVAFRNDDGVKVMKRIVGLPGETIQMRHDGTVVIDGEPLALPEHLGFLHYFPYGNLMFDKSVECRDGYFLLGDESQDSDDSRFNGPLPVDRVTGRAWLILAPGEHRGFVR
jgi:signal peptidase I